MLQTMGRIILDDVEAHVKDLGIDFAASSVNHEGQLILLDYVGEPIELTPVQEKRMQDFLNTYVPVEEISLGEPANVLLRGGDDPVRKVIEVLAQDPNLSKETRDSIAVLLGG